MALRQLCFNSTCFSRAALIRQLYSSLPPLPRTHWWRLQPISLYSFWIFAPMLFLAAGAKTRTSSTVLRRPVLDSCYVLCFLKNGGRTGRLKQPNYCSLHFLSCLFIRWLWHQLSWAAWHRLVTLRDCRSPSILGAPLFSLLVLFTTWFGSSPVSKTSPIQIVEVVMAVIWYGSSAFTLEDDYCP